MSESLSNSLFVLENSPELAKQQLLQRRSSQIGKGCGLGLTVSNMISHKMGGQLSVVSELGKGSTFTLGLPFKNGLSAVESSTDVAHENCKTNRCSLRPEDLFMGSFPCSKTQRQTQQKGKSQDQCSW
jgi:hypothetical protein